MDMASGPGESGPLRAPARGATGALSTTLSPGAPLDKDLYDLPPEEEKSIPTVCHSLDQALAALDADRDFLKAGGVL
jgi:glutamine synthetase